MRLFVQVNNNPLHIRSHLIINPSKFRVNFDVEVTRVYVIVMLWRGGGWKGVPVL